MLTESSKTDILICKIYYFLTCEFSSLSRIADINECSNNPCMNGGTCIDLIDDYYCNCQGNYGGKRCSYRELSPIGIPPFLISINFSEIWGNELLDDFITRV